MILQEQATATAGRETSSRGEHTVALDIEGIKYMHSKCLESFQISDQGVTRHQSSLGLRIQESRVKKSGSGQPSYIYLSKV